MGSDVSTLGRGTPPWVRRRLALIFPEVTIGPLPVAEVLLQVAALAPGGEAITLLQSLAGRVMSFQEQLRVIALWQPQLAWITGAEQVAVLAFAGPTPHPQDERAVLHDEFAPINLAPVLNCTVDHAQERVWKARQLSEQFTDLGHLLRSGQLDSYRVQLIVEVLTTLDTPEQRDQVEAEILPVAATLAPAKLRKELRKLARQVDPLWNTTMFARARKTRRVVFTPEGEDGLVGMHAYLPPVEAIALQQHLDKAAQCGPVDDSDVRCHDERMCDALIGAVLGTTPGDPSTPMSPDVTLNVFVPLPLLVGLQNNLDGTGELTGFGEIPADLVRGLAADASWRRWVTEPVTGHLLDLGKGRYKPSPELAEYVRARDRYCRYPGCTRKAARADLDHLDPYNHHNPRRGGSTSTTNLASECRRHHRGKTLRLLTVTGDPSTTLTWTDQHGQTGETQPHNYNNGL